MLFNPQQQCWTDSWPLHLLADLAVEDWKGLGAQGLFMLLVINVIFQMSWSKLEWLWSLTHTHTRRSHVCLFSSSHYSSLIYCRFFCSTHIYETWQLDCSRVMPQGCCVDISCENTHVRTKARTLTQACIWGEKMVLARIKTDCLSCCLCLPPRVHNSTVLQNWIVYAPILPWNVVIGKGGGEGEALGCRTEGNESLFRRGEKQSCREHDDLFSYSYV